jgi:hypothetical protein
VRQAFDKAERTNAESRNDVKRRLVKLVVFLLLGAIVNVAVAWGCLCWAPIASETPLRVPTAAENSIWHRFIDTEKDATCTVRSQAKGITYLQISGAIQPNTFRITPTADGRVSGVSEETWPNTTFGKIVVMFIAGWPMRSLSGARFESRSPIGQQPGGSTWISFQGGSHNDDPWLTYPPRDDTAYKSAIPTTMTRDGKKQYRLLPLRPVWPGFAINTVFFAMILWTLFAAPFALRRRRRIRRGLCPACAYPVGDSAVCTECGKALPLSLARERARVREATT